MSSSSTNETASTGVVSMDIDNAKVNSSTKKMSDNSTVGNTIKTKNDAQLPWVEKYRPQSLEDLVAHDEIINILTNLIDSGSCPHLLFYGPPGTGKTSTIVAAAKRMYGGQKEYSSMTLELNASDSRGIDVVRNEIKEFAGTKQLFKQGIKLIILDEADAMTSDAQFALRRVIEKYTKNARFCLICNYVSKIIPALQSRCTRFRFAPLSRNQIQGRLVDIAQTENCNITDDGINAILDLSNGDMRRVLNLLQSTAMSSDDGTDTGGGTNGKVIDETAVYLTSGSPLPQDVDTILDMLLNHDFQTACKNIIEMCTANGYALTDIISELAPRLTNMEGLDSIPLASLLDGLSQVEHRLANGTDEKLQTASLVGVFVQTRQRLLVVK